MSETLSVGLLPDGFSRGRFQGQGLIREITESMQGFLLDGWDQDRPRPRIEEDLSFVPKDRQEVIYIYMYRAAQNTSLKNSKHWRASRVSKTGEDPDPTKMLYERPPIYLELYYMVAVHSKFRSDAERLLGWTMLRLWEANTLIYRPRKYLLPDGTEVDSMFRPYDINLVDDEDVIVERVGLAMVDDLPIGDAINFFTIHEAPYRPYLTYRAQCSMEGSLIQGPATTIATGRMAQRDVPRAPHERPSGRLGRATPEKRDRPQIGPKGFDHRRTEGEDD